jgi:hypothetical protein
MSDLSVLCYSVTAVFSSPYSASCGKKKKKKKNQDAICYFTQDGQNIIYHF